MLAENRLVPLRQLVDELMGVNLLGGLGDVLQCETRVAATDVLGDRAREERVHAADED